VWATVVFALNVFVFISSACNPPILWSWRPAREQYLLVAAAVLGR